MKENKLVKWIKKNKTYILTFVGCGILGVCNIAYRNNQMSIEGSELWLRNAKLDDLNNYRDKVWNVFRNTSDDTEYTWAEGMLNRLDNMIENIKWGNSSIEYNIPSSEHGWYLPSDD